MPFLVSLCNLGPWRSRCPVAVVDDDLGNVALLNCDGFMLPDADAGITGMALHQGDLLLCVQSTMPRLVRLDRHFDVRVVYPLTEALDPHSICLEGAEVLIASSRRNRVFALDLDTGRECCRLVADPATTDIVHINGLTHWNGDLVVSMLGPRTDHGRQQGRVVAETGAVIAAGLCEPHSLTVSDGDLLVLESTAGRCLSIGPQHRELAVRDGYLRGMSVSKNAMVVGRSAWRGAARAGLTASDRRSGLIRVDRRTNAIQDLDVTRLGPEIYDVVFVPERPPRDRLRAVADPSSL